MLFCTLQHIVTPCNEGGKSVAQLLGGIQRPAFMDQGVEWFKPNYYVVLSTMFSLCIENWLLELLPCKAYNIVDITNLFNNLEPK